jgi:cobalt-zinc-cadmium efflux system outer membrane protein
MSFRLIMLGVLLGGALSARAQSTVPAAMAARGVSLTQALAAARDNLDVALSRRALEAARADVVSADHAPVPVVILKASQIDLQNGVGGGNLLRDKRIDKSAGVDWTWERGNKRELLDLQAFSSRAAVYQKSIVPQARQVAAMAELAYSKGALSLTDLIDARRTLRNALVEEVAARADHARALVAWQLRNASAAP